LGDGLRTVDISEEDTKYICYKLDKSYRHSNYLVLRYNDSGENQIFCYAGSDIIDADNIASVMNALNDGWAYYKSDEVTSFE